MKFRIALVLALACYLLPLAAPADARPLISLARATAVAKEYTQEYIGDTSAESDDDPEAVQVVDVDLAGCDLETRFRVLCDIELNWDDGSVDEDIITVLISRRGTYFIKSY